MALEIEWTDDSGATQVLDFDASVSERYASPATVTEHAVERGAAISDHVIPGTDTVTLEAVASNYPITVRSFGLDGAAPATQAQAITVGGERRTVNVLASDQAFDRVRAVDAQLVALRDAGQLLTVRTGLREITSAVIESAEVARDSESAHILAVTITVRRVRIATTQRVAVTRPVQRRGQNAGARGNQQGTDAGHAHDSVLGRLGAGNALAGLLGH